MDGWRRMCSILLVLSVTAVLGEKRTLLLATPKPIQCKENEVYRTCRIICPPQTCVSIYSSYDCRNATQCEPGCDCLPEYLRNGTDKDPCIPSNLCPINDGPPTPDCGINEHYETDGTKCDLTCKNYDLGAQIGPCEPRSGCFCDDGHVRNSNGLCIPKKKCPKNIVCKKNEVLSECYNSCHTTCKTRIRGDGRMCSLACVDTGCLCIEGYLRHDNGTCVPVSECSPPQCHENETYSSCGSACPATCQNRGDTCSACTAQCVEDCFCSKGYVRAEDGTCVKPKDCPPRTCSGPNEYFDECPPTCPPTDGCSNIWSKFNCTNAIKCCKPQCRCNPGNLRRRGICVPTGQCTAKPIQCKANEVYRTCRIICPPQTCASIYTDYDCRNATQCEPGCDCLPEYLRNGTDKDPCIPSNLCPINGGPPTPNCGINEHYETDGTKRDLTCKNYDLGAQIGPCEPRSGCFCDDGHVRNSNGLCIAKQKCPKNIVCKKNEVLSECYNSCHTTCKTRIRGDGRMCSLACVDTGCLCIEGYLRHDNGTCVPVSECSPPQCHENETYSSCGSACPATCQNRGDTCSACTAQCVEDCFCSKGYVRAEDGTCVKPKDCPARTCNGPNEYFDECPPTCPPTDGCSNIWSKFNCTNAIKCCKPQCRCNSGSYRKNGICVPIEQCTSSG